MTAASQIYDPGSGEHKPNRRTPVPTRRWGWMLPAGIGMLFDGVATIAQGRHARGTDPHIG